MAKRDARTLTRERIVETAVRIGDSESLDTLTVRRLAGELGVGAMTLYSYFRNKEEILDAMADHVLGGMEVPPAETDDPIDLLVGCGRAFRAMMLAHPCVVRLLSTRVTDSIDALDGAMEAVLDRLESAGLKGADATRAYGVLITYALGFSGYQTPRTWGDDPEGRRQRHHFYAGLPADRFPSTVRLAPELPTLASSEQFEFGLRLIAEGLAAAKH
ncbi:TetR/AcrR family transcriptional regulator C-terminal domain-containing protein [Actinomadura luteofluorescens]|uniref:TetR/AcrR family transcriptional regulator C-terminal domain-containing protein n=1 Tax=Actinomadura luteofluorescens TaxID=46163 RepID=UPI0030D41C7E